MSSSVDVSALVAAAREARSRAHAPYSGFAVGAAVLAGDGTLVSGANFENASLGLSLCAEAVALAAANSAGLLGGARAIAIVGDGLANPSGAVVTPCGRCRQLLVEAEHVAGGPLTIYCAPATGKVDESVLTFSVSGLLPHAFGPEQLGASSRGD